MQVLWNGEALETFKPSRGIHQGDPLSPYIFVLCLERLFHLIEIAVTHELWKPIKLSKKGPPLSYLAFADDLILFSEASLEQAEIIKTCLELFCTSSGMKVNHDKTRVHFSKNVGWVVKNETSDTLGFQRTDNLGKYLGVQLHHTRVSKRTLNSVMEHVNRRLNQWKVKKLSFAGRLTLTRSVLAAIPSYTMQTVFFPRQLCDELDRSCRTFLWGHTMDYRRIHALDWSTVCKEKKEGGLGIREFRMVNTSFMMKNCWTICSQPERLWVQILRSKYGCGDGIIPKIACKKVASNIWRGICHAWGTVLPMLTWNIGDGKTVKFWSDKWLPSRTVLVNNVDPSLPSEERQKVVADYINPFGNCEIERIRQYMPQDMVSEILGMAPPNGKNEADCIVWGGSRDGKFTIKSTYASLRNHNVSRHNPLFPVVWNWNGPERVRCFLWRVVHNSLCTNVWRVGWGLSTDASCLMCSEQYETSIHILHDCVFAKSVWKHLHAVSNVRDFFETHLQDWLTSNLESEKISWATTFALGLDSIWKTRNMLIFNQVKMHELHISHEVLGRVNEIKKGSILKIDHAKSRLKTNQHIGWIRPPNNTLKLNCDGAVDGNAHAACGGVLRDCLGKFIFGFAGKIGTCSVLQAELWAIFHGLRIIKEMNLKGNFLIESDSEIAVKFLNEGCSREHPCYSLVNHIVRVAGEI
uniref:Ribonuclease H protein At1g65750 family n=1 Tax=Cajanus cajan TaxID=3821 RepID=A0A151S7T3_CAJCA|nr:Putative ribonuclease H protein At1g65750 family [Cajanus cajan]